MPSSLLFSLSLSSHSNSYRLRAMKMILTTMHKVMKTSVKASKTMNESTSEIRIQIQAQSHVHKILHTLVVVSFAFLLNLSISSSSESYSSSSSSPSDNPEFLILDKVAELMDTCSTTSPSTRMSCNYERCINDNKS